MLIRGIKIWHIIIVVFGVYAVMKLSIDPITWDSFVAVGLFLIVIVPSIIIWCKRRCERRVLFKPQYQLSDTGFALSHKVEASEDTQDVQLTLKMGMETHVEFIALLYDGQGTLPVIQTLYDWQRDKKGLPHFIHAEPVKERFYWRYDFPEHRHKGSRITIGISYKATEYFKGCLVIQLSCTDGFKEQRLPFIIFKKSS